MWHPTFRFLLANVFFFVVFVAYENTYTPASAGVVGSLLINGDFENGLTGWNLDGSPDLVSGRIGGSALRSIQERTADQTPNWRGIRQQVPVTAGQPYEFSVWVKDVNSLGSHHMKIIWRDVLNQEIGVDYDNYWDQEPSSEWVEKVRKFVARPFAVTAEIVLWHGVTDNNGTHINVTGSTLLIDDVLFTPLQCTSEHICNPNFEDGLNFWRNTEKATVVQGRSGNGIQINNESGGNVHVFQVLSGVFQKDKTYQASVWCKALEGQECSIFFGDEGSGYENTDHLTILGNDDWQHLTVRVALTKDEVMSLYLY